MSSQRHGISKFDGVKWENYTQENSGLKSNLFCAPILFDKDNNLWVGCLFYLNKFDGKNWESWTTPKPLDAIWAICDMKFDNNGVLWMGGSTTVSKFYFGKLDESGINIFQEIQKTVYALEIDDTNNKWLGIEDGRLIKYDGTTFTTYDPSNSTLPGSTIHSIKKDNAGNLWLACGRQLIKFDGTTFTSFTPPLISDNDWICRIEFDPEGNTWLGTRNSGLIKFSNGNFKQINTTDPLLTIENIDSDSQNQFSVSIEGEYLTITTTKHIEKLDAFDITGKLIGKKTISLNAGHSCQIRLSDLNMDKTGIYLIKGKGVKESYTKKIIVRY